ncbi:MAG: copper chaperone PCu(A)C [Marinobacter sp.]
MLKTCLLILGLCAVSITALAHDFRQGDVVIERPWSRPTPPGTPVGVGYMTIHNQGGEEVTLVGGETPRAGEVTIHETILSDGMMKMQPLPDGLTVPAGESVALKPQSYHLMLESLPEPLKEGEEVPLILIFEDQEIEIKLRVEHREPRAKSDHSSH